MRKGTKNEDILKIALETVHRKPFGCTSRSHDELGVAEVFAVIGGDLASFEIGFRNVSVDKIDAALLEELF